MITGLIHHKISGKRTDRLSSLQNGNKAVINTKKFRQFND